MQKSHMTQGSLQAMPFKREDASKFVEWFNLDAEQAFFTSSALPFPCTAEDFLKYYEQNNKPDSHEFFSVLHVESGQHIGHFEIKNISRKFRAGTLAHVFLGEPNVRKQGLGKDLVKLMAKVGLQGLNLFRVGLSVHVVNLNAVSAYVKGGFFFEGIVRDVLEKDGKRFSLYQMSLLTSEVV